nr:DUF502 domain-containing protein [Microvirga massiliensis]
MRLRNYFLTGLIVAGPLTITIYITWWFITLVDGWVKPLVPVRYLPETYLPFEIPGFGLVIAFTGLTLLGFLTANLVGRTLIDIGELVLNRMPVVRGIYKGTKQVFETIFSANGTSFRTVGLVQFPVKGTWSIVFISNTAGGELTERLPPAGEYVGVFLPCTPNPTTGFFFYLPREEVIELAMSVDDAAKLVMSAGVIQPEIQRQLRELANADGSPSNSR